MPRVEAVILLAYDVDMWILLIHSIEAVKWRIPLAESIEGVLKVTR